MTYNAQPAPPEVRLDDDSIVRLAAALAELIRDQSHSQADPPATDRPRRLLSAAEVSEWWGVERGWVYAHATELGAIQLGTGRRPRLRFDPDRVEQRLSGPECGSRRVPESPPPGGRRCSPISADEPLVPYEPDSELSSSPTT